MTAFLVFWVLSGQFLDGSRIQVAPQLELRFNIFFRGARCDKGKMLAMPIWINEEGTWVDERSSDMSPEDMKGRVAGGNRFGVASGSWDFGVLRVDDRDYGSAGPIHGAESYRGADAGDCAERGSSAHQRADGMPGLLSGALWRHQFDPPEFRWHPSRGGADRTGGDRVAICARLYRQAEKVGDQ